MIVAIDRVKANARSDTGNSRSGTLYIALRYLDAIIHSLDPLDTSSLHPAVPSRNIDNLASFKWHDPSTAYDSITPTAPRKPMVIPNPIQTLVPHLIPMLRLMDQTAEYRNYCSESGNREMLLDMVEIIMRHGVDALAKEEVWEEQDRTVWEKGDIAGLDGVGYRPWRAVRYDDAVAKGDEGTKKRARAAIKHLEQDAEESGAGGAVGHGLA